MQSNLFILGPYVPEYDFFNPAYHDIVVELDDDDHVDAHDHDNDDDHVDAHDDDDDHEYDPENPSYSCSDNDDDI